MGVAELKEKIRLRLGNALSLEDYNKKIDEAFDDLKNGNVFSNEEMHQKIARLKHK